MRDRLDLRCTTPEHGKVSSDEGQAVSWLTSFEIAEPALVG